MPVSNVLSVNLGRAEVSAASRKGVTGIDKIPTSVSVGVQDPGRKGLGGSGLAGDTVCDLGHHGGSDQAVYAYAREDLDGWQRQLGRDLRNGQFGENLTTIGVEITHALLGEVWAVGAQLKLQVTVPRVPCRTFAAFLHERGWVRRFAEAGTTGTYLRVLVPGPVRAGDTVAVLERPDHGVTVRTAFRAFTTRPELLAELARVPTLGSEARAMVERRAPLTFDADADAHA
ncbi:MOSC domain-containing protein [Nakamurella sp. A5-74]|uniref:MOSC domain-containing protein n=1 Tax=Nakamurella sp. A5-74 TaxID=3158264 RepID=A0AAU8DKT7_9ACTN